MGVQQKPPSLAARETSWSQWGGEMLILPGLQRLGSGPREWGLGSSILVPAQFSEPGGVR